MSDDKRSNSGGLRSNRNRKARPKRNNSVQTLTAEIGAHYDLGGFAHLVKINGKSYLYGIPVEILDLDINEGTKLKITIEKIPSKERPFKEKFQR